MRMSRNGPLYVVFDSCKRRVKGKRHYGRPKSDDITT